MIPPININLNKIAVAIIVALILFFFFQESKRKSEVNNLVKSISSYNDSVSNYRLKNGKLVAFNKTLELENKTQLKAYLNKDDDFKLLLKKYKQVTGGITIVDTFRIQGDTIKLTDTIPCHFNPIKFERILPYYSLNGTITETQFVLDTLIVPNTIKIVLGQKRVGLFSKETRVEVVNSNPYVTTTNLSAVTVKEKKKWYGTQIFSLGIGVIASFFLIK